MFRVFRCLGSLRCLLWPGCLGVWVFRVFRVDDILEGQKGDQEGGPKLSKIQYGVKPDIFKITGPPSAGPPSAGPEHSGFGGVVQRPKLRPPQCHGVRRFQFNGQDWLLVGQGATQFGQLGQDVSM